MKEKTDYRCYKMSALELATAYLLGFAGVFVTIYIFFENSVLSIVIGIIFGFISIKPFNRYLESRRKKKLLQQFKDFLESLAASYTAGSNTQMAFLDTYGDIELLYGQSSYMAIEINLIKTGLENGNSIENMIDDFAVRSGIDDIKSFAGVFNVCIRMGGNISSIIAETREIICDKIEIEMEIRTAVAQKKSEFYILCIMPYIMIVALKFFGDSTFSTSNIANIVVRAIALLMIIISYVIGKIITDIKI